jgi:hypothetical protein
MRRARPVLLGLPLLLALPLLTLGLLHPAGAANTPTWAPAATAAVHPGVQTRTEGAQCTADFVFYDASRVFIGQAAHCSGGDGDTATDGCTSSSAPLGTKVTVSGASKPGTMVYNSWLAMQAAHEKDAGTCQFNDLALVQLDPADAASVYPSVPFWGGPAGLNTAGTASLQAVYSYGNSKLRLGLDLLSPKKGLSLGDQGGGWSHLVTTITPGVPGDSGSPFLDASGRALGVLSTLDIGVPGGVSNGVGDLARELGYLRTHGTGLATVQLALGTTPFNGNKLPLGL